MTTASSGSGLSSGSGPKDNLWRDTCRESVTAPPLGESVSADLVIIGGGFTGCSAALHAAERGMSVRLLEAETIGHGGSGRNVGLVNAGLWLPPEAIVAQLGAKSGAVLNQALGAAPDLVFELIEKHAIECEATRAGTLHCAHAPAGLRDLEERHRQLAALGAPVTLLDAAETERRTGSPRFFGALHDARAGTIQPLAYCRGLARAAIAAGAALHEGSPALRVAREATGWRVETAAGVVTARALLLATNAYHVGALGLSPPRTTPVGYFQTATRPLSPNLRQSVLAGREGCWDTATVMSSFRMDAAGRMIIGGIGSLDSATASLHRSWARRQLGALFPQLADQPLEHAWSGRIAMTADHVPKALTLGPDAYAIFGYSGRGIGPGTVFGRAAAAALSGVGDAAFPVAVTDRYAESFTGLKQLYYETGASLTHAIARRGG